MQPTASPQELVHIAHRLAYSTHLRRTAFTLPSLLLAAFSTFHERTVMQALRGGRSALQLLAQPCSLQISNLSSLASLGSWWQGSATPTATSAAGVSLQRLAALWPALLPSPLSDSQWLAVPKHKASSPAVLSPCNVSKLQKTDAVQPTSPCL
jgi:hypothetical protein